MRVHKEHRIECSAERFWELTFDPEFQKAMNIEAMSASSYEMLERSVEGPTWRMRSRTTPKDNMPGFIKKLVGGSFAYEDVITHDKGTDRATSAMTPSALKDKTRMSFE